jgi:hypothetical protein
MLHLLPRSLVVPSAKTFERSSLVTAGRRIFFDSDAGEGAPLPA